MKALRSCVDKVVDWAMVALFLVIFLVVLTQIFFRYVINSPLVWTEELSRILFIWVSLAGWVLATRHNTHIRITFFQERLSAPVRKMLNILFRFCTLAFLAVLCWLGWKFAMSTRRTAVTITAIPMMLVYLSLPVSSVLGIFYLVIDFFLPQSPPSAAVASAPEGREGAE